MIEVYLFDWGDTLMRDFPEQSGKMCDWERIEIVDGAKEVLAHLSAEADIYIATGAKNSTAEDIERAFKRVHLSKYISGYFCHKNIGVSKNNPEFFPRILGKLNKKPSTIAMIGDNLEKDIVPAINVGIKAIWLKKTVIHPPLGIKSINNLRELCT